MYPKTEQMNRRVLALDDTHPAKRFLTAFMDCTANCAGREVALDGETPIDQAWISDSDRRPWTFSGLMYAFLCFDIELDGFLTNAPQLTASEISGREQMPRLRSMMAECAQAARQSGNSEILELTDQVQQMLNLWEQYISFREGMIARAKG
jgi:hypothetical protein